MAYSKIGPRDPSARTIRLCEGSGIMSRKLFWLSDEQWVRIELHSPTDVL
jgi:hypothetical protein